MWLACRHHINEIILRSVFECHFTKTSGPNVIIFSKFESAWKAIDKNKFDNSLKDKVVMLALKEDRDSISNFILTQLEVCTN